MKNTSIQRNGILNISMLIMIINLFVIMFASPIYTTAYTNLSGSYLCEFTIVNNQLDSVTDVVMEKLMDDEETKKHTSLVLELNENKDSIEFVYYTCGDERAMNPSTISEFIAVLGRRVIGFIHRDGCDIYLLTNIPKASYAWVKLGKLVEANSENYKHFPDVYYNSFIYYFWNVGFAGNYKGWHFQYYKGKVSRPYYECLK